MCNKVLRLKSFYDDAIKGASWSSPGTKPRLSQELINKVFEHNKIALENQRQMKEYQQIKTQALRGLSKMISNDKENNTQLKRASLSSSMIRNKGIAALMNLSKMIGH